MPQEIQKRTRQCPYCFRMISNEETAFLVKTDGVRFRSPALNAIFAEKTDEPYLFFWSSMGLPEEQIDARRVIIDMQSHSRLNQELAASRQELAARRYDPESCGFSFHVRESAVSVFSNTMVCPHCHNVLPHNFFRDEMLMIGLAGSVASGKTVYLTSLLMNGFATMQRENLSVRHASGNVNDPYRREMEQNADRLMVEGICPESTIKTFRPPLFLDVTYHAGTGVFHLITAIYDVAGELIQESGGSGRTGFVRYMDGFICLIDPAQMHLEHSFISQGMPDEAIVLSKLHLMTPEEQRNIQSLSNRNGKQVMDPSDFMEERYGGMAGYFTQRKPDILFDTLRSILGETGMRQKMMALTITKSDLLEELGEIRSYKGSRLLFERNQVTYGFMDMDHHFLRQKILWKLFDQKAFRLQRNLSDYRAGSLFLLSALGCETQEDDTREGKVVRTVGKVKPIRVEEPVLWMIMQTMRERGWLD